MYRLLKKPQIHASNNKKLLRIHLNKRIFKSVLNKVRFLNVLGIIISPKKLQKKPRQLALINRQHTLSRGG